MDFEKILQEIVLFLNEANGDRRQQVLQESAERIMYDYVILNREGAFYRQLEEALCQDTELYTLVLSTIWFITQDGRCLDIVDDLILDGAFDLFTSANLCFQLTSIRFRDEKLVVDYRKQRDIQRELMERFETEYPVVPEYIPYEERHPKRIVVETDCINGYYHAPTRVVMEMCRVLQEELGYEVFLLVNMSGMERKRMEQFWLFPYVRNYKKSLDGSFSLSYQDCKISGYQLSVNTDSIGELQEILTRIREWKPLCIWHIGGSEFLHDIYRGMTTVLSMPCTDGFSVSEAQVMISYMQSGSEQVQKQEQYIQNQNQKLLPIQIAAEYKVQEKKYKKSEFGFSEDAFVLCIVGNRLDDEISQSFIDMLEDVVLANERIAIAVIGQCYHVSFPAIPETRVKFLGFRKDLLDVIKMTDLFVNPPRKGGGGGAIRAITVGIPVITLPRCDVANTVSEDFFVQSLDEMGQCIQRYCDDSGFYMSQQQKVKELFEMRGRINSAESVGNMLVQVKEWLQNGEIV